MSGNLGLIDLGLPHDKCFDLIHKQIYYFRTLCDDAVDYSWPLVREAHKAVLLALEQGLLSPNDIEGMLDKKKLCLEHAFRHNKPEPFTAAASGNFSSASRTGGPEKAAPGVLLRVCKHYNEGKCNFPEEHQKGAYLWTHICAFCWHKLKQKRSHPESECEMKKKDGDKTDKGKNEKGGT